MVLREGAQVKFIIIGANLPDIAHVEVVGDVHLSYALAVQRAELRQPFQNHFGHDTEPVRRISFFQGQQ